MRLPQRVRTRVQSLGRESVSGELAVGRAYAGAAQQVAGSIDHIYQIDEQAKRNRIENQTQEASLSMAETMGGFEQQYAGKEYIPIEELPEGINVRRTERVVNDAGQVEEIERQQVPAYEVLPSLYKQYANAHLDALSSSIEDDEARNNWYRDMGLKVQQGYVRELEQSRTKQSEFITARTLANVENAVNSGKYDVARELTKDIKDSRLKSETLSNIEFKESDGYYNDLVLSENADPEEINAAITELRDPEVELPLSDGQRLAKANALESNLMRVTAADRAKEERAKQERVSNAWLLIDEGSPQVDESYVQDMFDSGIIEGGTRTAMIRSIRKKRDEAIKKEAVKIDLDQIASAGYGIDPKDKDARAAVNERYEEYVQQSDDPWGSASRVMQEYKVVPEPIISMFRSANRADAPNLGQAVELYIDAQDHAPSSLEDFKEGEVDFIENIAAQVRNGMDLQSAVEAEKRWQNLTPQQRATLGRNSKTLSQNNVEKLSDQISDHPSYDIPWSISDPEVPAFMQSEYQAMVERELPNVGFNLPVAQNKAFANLTKRWSLTDVNGDWKLMRDMPKVPPEYVRGAIADSYKGQLKQFNEFHGRQFKMSDIKIYADSLTRIQMNNGQKPTYMAYLMVDEETGEIEQLPRFTWDAGRVLDKERRKLLKEAQQQRPEALQRLEEIEADPTAGMQSEMFRGF